MYHRLCQGHFMQNFTWSLNLNEQVLWLFLFGGIKTLNSNSKSKWHIQLFFWLQDQLNYHTFISQVKKPRIQPSLIIPIWSLTWSTPAKCHISFLPTAFRDWQLALSSYYIPCTILSTRHVFFQVSKSHSMNVRNKEVAQWVTKPFQTQIIWTVNLCTVILSLTFHQDSHCCSYLYEMQILSWHFPVWN